MPAVLSKGHIETILPPGLSSLDIQVLTPRTDLENKYVQATVHHRYQHTKLPVSTLKCILRNNEGNMIELMAIGQVADDLNICVKGDVLVFLKFEVEACPGHCRRSCQMIVDDTGNVGSLVWIFKNTDGDQITSAAKAHQMSSTMRSYSYKPLAELRVNTVVDVYGVVKFCKPSTKTKGSDFCCILGITDPSLGSTEDKLLCNIFSRSEEQLPKIEVGYIVRFHRLKIRTFCGKMQGYNGPGFQWLIFCGSFEDRQASSASYTVEQQDEFKVIRVCDLDFGMCKVLRVWDGSKFEGLLKMVEEAEFNDTVQEDGSLMEASDDMAVDIYVFDDHVLTAGSIKPGNFIQLTNLHAAGVSEKVELILHGGGTSFSRGIEVLPEDAPQIQSLKTFLSSIIEEKMACKLLLQDVSVDDSTHRKDSVSHSEVVNTNRDQANNEAITSETALSQASLLVGSNANNESGNVKVLKQQPVLVTDNERNNKTKTGKVTVVSGSNKHHLEAASNVTCKKRMKRSHAQNLPDVDDSLEISSGSDSQSLWFSAYGDSEAELQVKRGLTGANEQQQVQDSNISSSGNSIDGQCVMSSGHGYIVISDDTSEDNCAELNKNLEQLSQDSFHTACSLELVDTADGTVHRIDRTAVQTSVSETIPAQKFLSLKSKSNTQETVDNNQPVTFNSSDVLSLSSSILCFDTVHSTNRALTAHTHTHGIVVETEASQCMESMSADTSPVNSSVKSMPGSHPFFEPLKTHPRCMLKTASTVTGHHKIDPEFSLKEVRQRGVCQKFKVLVRVQDMTPRPVSPSKLVNFICFHCGHIESAESVAVPLDVHSSRHVCPSGARQSETLKPVIILSLVLTDGKDSLTAYVWDKHAVELLGGIEPMQLLSDADSFSEVKERLESLCPLGSRLHERPLLECCLFSYGTETNVKYQIFDTVLV